MGYDHLRILVQMDEGLPFEGQNDFGIVPHQDAVPLLQPVPGPGLLPSSFTFLKDLDVSFPLDVGDEINGEQVLQGRLDIGSGRDGPKEDQGNNGKESLYQDQEGI
jgi:hypothetical protein